MELAILVVIIAIIVGMILVTSKGMSGETGADGEADEPAATRFCRRYWWLAPVLILISVFLL